MAVQDQNQDDELSAGFNDEELKDEHDDPPEAGASDDVDEGESTNEENPKDDEKAPAESTDEPPQGQQQQSDEPDYKALFAKADNERRAETGRLNAERREREKLMRRIQELEELTSRKREVKTPDPLDDDDDDEMEDLGRREPPPKEKVITADVDREEQARKAALDAHVAAIASAHADWKTVVQGPEFGAWIATDLPSWARDRAEQIIQAGTATEVADLISDFKKARAPRMEKQQHETGEKRRKAEEAAGAIRSDGTSPRTNVAGRSSSSDFDAGWRLSERRDQPINRR